MDLENFKLALGLSVIFNFITDILIPICIITMTISIMKINSRLKKIIYWIEYLVEKDSNK